MTGILVDRDVGTEMRDGVELTSDVYRPSEGSHPAILLRTPYSKDDLQLLLSLFDPIRAVEDGFAVIYQDCRGRYASDGEWEPFFFEEQDGYDTVEWVAEQAWCNGRVGIMGPSYLGVTTWQTVISDPPHLEAALPIITSGNIYDGWVYYAGVFELGFNLQWTILSLLGGTIESQGADFEELDDVTEKFLAVADNRDEVMSNLPLNEVPELIEKLSDYYVDWLHHPSYDDYWKRVDVTEKIESVSVPVLEIGGWYDKFINGAFDISEAIRNDSSEFISNNYYQIFGPWHHLTFASRLPPISGDRDFGITSAISETLDQYTLPWFEYHLQDERNKIEDLSRVRYFQMGKDEWRDADSWPPATSDHIYYLNSTGSANLSNTDGRLCPGEPHDSSSPDSYQYDPLDPVPSVGGNTIMQPVGFPGVKDQSDVEQRDDVLVYTAPRLTESVSIVGRPKITLFVSSSVPDTDFTGKLVEVQPDGYCANISEGILRARYRESLQDPELLTPGNVYELEIQLSPTAHTFKPGHRIRLEISSSNFPRFARNPNTAKPGADVAENGVRVATNRVYHDEDHASKLVLPTRER